MNILKSIGAGAGVLLMMAGVASAQTIQAVSFQASGDTSVKMNLVTVINTGRVGTTIVLDGTRSSDDGEIKTYTWTQVSGPTVALKGDTTTKLSFTPSTPGTYVFELRATDRAGATTVVEKRQFTVDAQGPAVNITGDPDFDLKAADLNRDGRPDVLRTVDGGTIKGELQAGDLDRDGDDDAVNDVEERQLPPGDPDFDLIWRDDGDRSFAKVEVRGWDPKKKEAILGRPQDVGTDEDLHTFIELVADDNVAIRGIRMTENVVEVESQEEAKLFGFIKLPIRFVVVADMDSDGVEDRVKVKFPWWSFLATTDFDADGFEAEAASKIESFTIKQGIKAQAQLLSSISNVLKTRHDTAKNSISNIR